MESDKSVVRRYLEDAVYPAGQQELLRTAESNDVPTALVERLRNLPKGAEFSAPTRTPRRPLKATDLVRGKSEGRGLLSWAPANG